MHNCGAKEKKINFDLTYYFLAFSEKPVNSGQVRTEIK